MKYIMSLIIIIIVCVMFTGCVGEPDKTYKLYSLNTVTGTSGTYSGGFLIGYGHIDEEAYYFYYVQDLDGAYHMKKAYVEMSRIFMDTASDTAYVTIVDCMDNNNRKRQACSDYTHGYDFHVPPGTITIQFNGNVDRSVNGV